jgi:uncharacterized membrane protein
MRTPEKRRKFFKSLEAKSLRSRDFLTQVADSLTTLTGSPVFLLLNTALFAAWIVVNVGYVPGIIPFDPYPFGLLTMIVSLEAIFLSIFVLISQNRSAYIGTIRDEVHLQVNLTAEREVTKILEILAQMRKHMGLKEPDLELEEMLKNIDESTIERNIANQITRANRTILSQLKKEFPEVIIDVIKVPVEILQNQNANREADKKESPAQAKTQ